MTSENQVEPVGNISPKSSKGKKVSCNVHSILKFISSLLLPLMLGIFTVVITFQQDKSARKQREQDQLAARQLRELERSLNDERYFNDILDRYVENMGTLLKERNSLLQANEFMATLARAKTLNVLRQLDSQRIINVIRFLYEADQLSTRNRSSTIDLSTAALDSIDFRRIAFKKKILDEISLIGILFYNVTFAELEMRQANFTSANFDTVDFGETKFLHADFSSAIFDQTNMTHAKLRNTTFSFAEMSHTNYAFSSFQNVDLSNTTLDQVNFSSTILFNVSFISSKLIGIDFSFALLKDVSFTLAELFDVTFTSAQFQNVTFSTAKLHQVDFSSSVLPTYFQYQIFFTDSTLEMINFAFVKFFIVDFSSSQQFDVNYSHALLASASFKYAKFLHGNFHQASCLMADFTWANLTHVDFTDANLKGASFIETDLTAANLSNANLQKTDLWTTKVTEKQLKDAFAIHGARLRDISLILDRNLILNGQPECNMLLTSDWTIRTGKIVVRSQDAMNVGCQFVLESYQTGAIMSQRIDLSPFKHNKFYAYSKVFLNGYMGTAVIVQLISTDEERRIVAETNISLAVHTTSIHLHDHVKELEIIVKFYPVVDTVEATNMSWCHNLELYIDYGPDLIAPSRVEPLIPKNTQWVRTGEILLDKWNSSNGSDQFNGPHGIFISDDQSIYIADMENHRILFKRSIDGEIETVAGGNGPGCGLHQLNAPTDVLFDSQTGRILICDSSNKRVMKWSNKSAESGEVFIDSINCIGLAMDNQRSIYVSDVTNLQIKRYLPGDHYGIVVAGGEKVDSQLNQLRFPSYLFINQEDTLYISETGNHCVLKWLKEAKQSIVVAGGRGAGKFLNQLASAAGIWVDRLGRIYVAEVGNNRITRWQEGSDEGTLITDRIGSNQLSAPIGLFFDRHGHLYTTDRLNGILKRFRMVLD